MRTRIALVTGGYSGEREVSLKSGEEVHKHLDPSKFEVYLIRIEEHGWFYVPDESGWVPVDKNDFSITTENKKITFDCAFIAIHGTPGEDGKLQGYFDLLHIPYTSCGRTTSAVTFNKFFTNKIVRALGVNTAGSMVLSYTDKIDLQDIISRMGLPCFVKPNNGGSSVGVSRVDSRDGLQPALELAFGEDKEAVVEEFIHGFELTCGMFRYRNEIIALPLTQIISKKSFFDFEAKYTDGMVDEVTPAQVPDDLKDRCQDLSRFLYQQLNCKGIVRFDYIVNGDQLFFLEVNTIPGLTKNSIVPKMITTMGLSLREFYTMLIEEEMREES